MDIANIWRHCGSCKKPILLNQTYYLCGISTCRKTAYCSVPCFDDHVPIFRHKDAWAEERIAPKEADLPNLGKSRIDSAHVVRKANAKEESVPHEVLIVASKLKDYIRAKSGMNTSANVLDRLSDMVRLQCDKAIDRAKDDSRKTVMDRDFYF